MYDAFRAATRGVLRARSECHSLQRLARRFAEEWLS